MRLLQVQVPEDLFEAFRDVAYTNGETVSAVIRQCMRTVIREERAISYPSGKEGKDGTRISDGRATRHVRKRLGSDESSKEEAGE